MRASAAAPRIAAGSLRSRGWSSTSRASPASPSSRRVAAAVVDAAARAVFFELDGLELDLLLDQLLDVGHQARVVAAAREAHGQARGAGTAGAADAVHVVLGIERNVEVEDRGHVLDVEAAGRDVGAHQQVDLAGLEGGERLQAFVLALVAMQRRRCAGRRARARASRAQPQLAVDEHEGLGDAALARRSAGARGACRRRTRCRSAARRWRRFRSGRATSMVTGFWQVLPASRLISGEKVAENRSVVRCLGEVARGCAAGRAGSRCPSMRSASSSTTYSDPVEHRVLGFDVVEQPARRGHQHLDAVFSSSVCGFMLDAAEHLLCCAGWCHRRAA